MDIRKVLYIEDSIEKYMDVCGYLRRQGIPVIDSASDAEDAIRHIEDAAKAGEPYDLLISDMQFNYFGADDREAGEKTMNLLRDKGYEIPVIFCSSENWKIPGAVGCIFYNPRRDWESEADALLKKVRQL